MVEEVSAAGAVEESEPRRRSGAGGSGGGERLSHGGFLTTDTKLERRGAARGQSTEDNILVNRLTTVCLSRSVY